MNEKSVIIFILGIFLCLSCWYLELPGLNFDECLGAAPAVKFLYGSNTEPMQIDPSVIHIFGRPLPVMIMPYISGLKTLLHIPFYAIFGVSTVSTRLMPVTFVVISIWFFYLVVKKAKDARTATLSSLLFAVHPVTVFYMTRDITPVAISVLCLSVIFYSLHRWKDDRQNVYLTIIAFFSGLGVSHKADFIWMLLSLIPSFLMVYQIKPKLKEILLFAAGFAVGALPMIVFNFATGFMTFKIAGEKFVFWNMPSAFMLRIIQLGQLYGGGFVGNYFTGVFPLISITAAIIMVYLLFHADIDSKLSQVLVYTIGIFVLLSSFTQFSLQIHHLLVLVPLICVLMADTKQKSAAILLAVVFMLTSVSIDYDLKETKGVGVWSSTINELNHDLLEGGKIVNLRTHAFTGSLIALSKGKLKMRRVYAGEEPDSSELNLYREIQQDKIIKVYRDSRNEVIAVLTQ
jgi:hypothetical protein